MSKTTAKPDEAAEAPEAPIDDVTDQEPEAAVTPAEGLDQEPAEASAEPQEQEAAETPSDPSEESGESEDQDVSSQPRSSKQGGSRRSRGGQRRQDAMTRAHGVRYVNRMMNMGWLAGYSMPGDDRSFLLQQTNNIEQALRIEVTDRFAKLAKRVGRPVLVMVHVRGYRDKDGPQLALQCIGLDRPSLLDLPIDEVWAAGFGHKKESVKLLRSMSRSNFSPFDENGDIRKEYREYLASANSETGDYKLDPRAETFLQAHQMFGEILEASGGMIDSRLGRGQNDIAVAGFVDAKAWVAATEYRREYALFMIRQHEDQDRNIPVRVVGKMAHTYFKSTPEGSPVLVTKGRARRKVIPNDEGEIVSRHAYIETTKLSPAEPEKDILAPLPEWWGTIRDRLVKRAAERRARRAQAAKQAAQPAQVKELDDATLSEVEEAL